MTDTTETTRSEGPKIAGEIIRDGADDDREPSGRKAASYSTATSLTYAELVELWHHQHNVAMHKERLYVPVSLAVLVGTILNWKDLSVLVVSLAAIASVGVYWYLVQILTDFTARQDRFFTQMARHRVDVLRVMFNQSTLRFNADQDLVGPPTVQRRLRRPFVSTLIAVWLGLILIKAGVWK